MAQRHRRRFLRNLFLILIFSLILWYAKGCPLPTQEMELHRRERQRLVPESTVVWSYQGKRSGDRDMLVGLNPIIHKGKPAGAFGSYGWSGEAVPKLTAQMQAIGLQLPVEGLKVRFKPSEAQLAEARQFGLDFAAAVLA